MFETTNQIFTFFYLCSMNGPSHAVVDHHIGRDLQMAQIG